MSFRIQSDAFDDGERIPDQYTTEGEDISPPLTVSDKPENTEAIVLICDDPDAPQPEPWVHWLIWNIPASSPSLPEGVGPDEHPDEVPGARQGVNDFDHVGYGGPAPPPGHGTHRYRFTVYALDNELALPAGADREELEEAMDSHVIDRDRVTVTYER